MLLALPVLLGDGVQVCSSHFPHCTSQAVCISASGIWAHHHTSVPSAAWKNPFFFEPCFPKLQLEQAPSGFCFVLFFFMDGPVLIDSIYCSPRNLGDSQLPSHIYRHPSQHFQWWSDILDLYRAAHGPWRSAQSLEERAVTLQAKPRDQGFSMNSHRVA